MTAQPLAHDLADLSNPMVMQLADMIAARLTAPATTETITFGELFNLYFEKRVMVRCRNKSNSIYFYSKHGPRWANMMIHEIKRQDVQEWIDDLGIQSPSAANKALNAMKAIINWGIRRDHVPLLKNPCIGVELFTLQSRERFLLPSELSVFEGALQHEPQVYRDFFHLSLFTGARRGNVCSMRWDEIDLDLGTWTIPGHKFKTGKTLVVPLSNLALTILQRRKLAQLDATWVFPAGKTKNSTGHIVCVKRAWTRIMQKSGLKNLRIHDLRRTLASYLAIDGNNTFTIARMLGHSDTRSTAIYARLDVEAVRNATQNVTDKWQQLLAIPITASPTNESQSVNRNSDISIAAKQPVKLSSVQQTLLEAKIITAINYNFSCNNKKLFYRKIGSQFKVTSVELERVLTSMEARGLIKSFQDDKGAKRYALADSGQEAS